MASTRSIIAPPAFAKDASTVIPPTPIAGVSYRDPSAGPASSPDGWPYAERVNSAEFNQIMYQLSSLVEILDSKGILGWSDLVDYTVPAVQFGSDGNLYKWLQASGPANGGAKDPITNPSYWTPLSAALSSNVAGSSLGVRASSAAASSSVQFTADQIVVSSGLTGASYRLNNFSQVINLTTVGAGGMDAGSPPANGFVGIYAISDGVGGASLLAVNASASSQLAQTYAGGNMPAGYVASALISIVPTNGAGQMKIFSQRDRRISIQPVQFFSSSTGGLNLVAQSINTSVPYNATAVRGTMTTSSTAASNIGFTLDAANTVLGSQNVSGNVVAGGGWNCNFSIDISVPRTLYVSTTNTAGTPTYTASISQYEF